MIYSFSSDLPTSILLWYNRNGWLGVKHQVTYFPASMLFYSKQNVNNS